MLRAAPTPVLFASLLCVALGAVVAGAPQTREQPVTRQETLRGTISPEREWWDVLHYDLSVEFLPRTRSIRGSNIISFRTSKAGSRMQIDLQAPLTITKVDHRGTELKFERDGNVFWVSFDSPLPAGVEDEITIHYGGRPTVAKNPPWDGGVTWDRDDLGNWLINTTCEGIGASVWWPNKDVGSDEPDRGARINITVPEDLVDVSNGRLKGIDHDAGAKTRTYHWEVVNPINNYSVNANIGNYVNWSEKYVGAAGTLDVDYWALPHQKEAATKTFKEVPRMLASFESWFGPYPWYEDGYKLVTVSYPGMEHQSSVTYGNGFRNGFGEFDSSGTGLGLKFDFIIIHESAHEWFGNNISMRDAADMWIHEAFANYAENLFVESRWGKAAGADYVVGTQRLIHNDRPIIGTYGANRPGSDDMYDKGGNMLHMIRQIVNDDAKWRSILNGLNKEFWHQTVTSQQVESYLSQQVGTDLSRFFDQYLRTATVPVLQYRIDGSALSFKYDKVVPGFSMPVRVAINGTNTVLVPTDQPQTMTFPAAITTVVVDRNYYVTSQPLP